MSGPTIVVVIVLLCLVGGWLIGMSGRGGDQ